MIATLILLSMIPTTMNKTTCHDATTANAEADNDAPLGLFQDDPSCNNESRDCNHSANQDSYHPYIDSCDDDQSDATSNY